MTDTQATAITLYTKPACVQCNATKRLLDNRGLEYTTVDVTESEVALRFIKDVLGYQQAPVVYTSREVIDDLDMAEPATEIEHWSGFDADRIKAIVK